MAGRLPKVSIDYSGWSVTLFDNEPKMDKLLDAQGWDGFGVYFFLCQRAYGSEGYFYKWCYDDCATTARKMGGGIGAGTVKETVDYCLQIGLFDKGLFDRWGVLTSRGIQKRYIEVIKKRDVKEVITEYWLLHESEECKGLLKIPLNTHLSTGNTDFKTGNSNFDSGNSDFQSQKESKVKESKVKESKVKESKVKESKSIVVPAETTVTSLNYGFDPDSFEMRCTEKIIVSCLESFPKSKVPKTDREKSKWASEIEKMKRLDHLSEEEITVALNYAVEDSFWKTNIRSTKKFREKFERLYIQAKNKRQVGKTELFGLASKLNEMEKKYREDV